MTILFLSLWKVVCTMLLKILSWVQRSNGIISQALIRVISEILNPQNPPNLDSDSVGSTQIPRILGFDSVDSVQTPRILGIHKYLVG